MNYIKKNVVVVLKFYISQKAKGGGRTGLGLARLTPNRETRVRSSAGSVCCFLEQETFTPQKYW